MRPGEATAAPLIHALPTPEGVPLHLPVASAGDRAGAFMIDAAIVAGVLFALGMLAALFSIADTGFGTAFVLVAVFLLRNGYFVGFELLWRGSTPGKRALGLRVMDVHGAGLSTEAILARNLTREIETFVPLVMLIAPEALWPGGSTLVRVLAGLWGIGLLILPLVNEQRRRAGDFVAGTLVISTRDAELRRELVRDGEESGDAPAHTFTREQLALYGEYELQVLEELLRRPARERRDASRAVARRIVEKIGWDRRRKIADADAFLRDFYAAQRAALEKEMLFGRRYGDKHERSAGESSDDRSRDAGPRLSRRRRPGR